MALNNITITTKPKITVEHYICKFEKEKGRRVYSETYIIVSDILKRRKIGIWSMTQPMIIDPVITDNGSVKKILTEDELALIWTEYELAGVNDYNKSQLESMLNHEPKNYNSFNEIID